MRFLSSGQAKRSWQRVVASAVCVSFAFGFATPVSFADTTMVVPTPTLNAPAQGTVVPDGSPVITGWVTSGLLVEIHIDGSFNGWATVQESDSVTDSFYYTPFLPLTPGGHSYHARAKDPETGERSMPTQEIAFLVAEKLPAPTVLTPVVRASQSLQPLVVGLTYGNTTVEVFVDGMSQGKVTVQGDPVKVDDFALQTAALSEGTHMVYAVATDSLGRTSMHSDDVDFTVSKPKVSTANTTTSEGAQKPSETANESSQDETTESANDDAVVLGEEDDTADDSDDVAPTDEDDNATEDTDEETNTNEEATTTDDADDDNNDRSALVTWIVVIAVLVIILALRLRGNSGGKTGTDGTARSVFTGDHSSNPTTETKDDVPPPPPPPPSSSSY